MNTTCFSQPRRWQVSLIRLERTSGCILKQFKITDTQTDCSFVFEFKHPEDREPTVSEFRLAVKKEQEKLSRDAENLKHALDTAWLLW